MRFSYIIFDRNNSAQKGIIEASSLKDATQLLISQGWYIKKIKPLGTGRSFLWEFNFSRISLIDKVLFIRHLATMLKSGITLNEGLEIILDQSTSKKFRNVIQVVLNKVKTGRTLSDSLSSFPRYFDPLFINIIRVGEESGTLEKNLDYLASELEDRLELRRKIQAASIYPSIILLATFGLVVILAYFVLPKITRLFASLNFELPLSTKILLYVARVMDEHGLLVIGSIIALVIIFKVLVATKFFKPIWHKIVLRLPLVGHIVINYNLALINRTLGVLLKSGITIDQAVEIVSTTVSNMVYKKRLELTLPQIQKGKRFSDALASFSGSRKRPLFSLIVTRMIGVGERSGRLEESFEYLAEYFDKEVDSQTKNLTTILEPILLVIIGLIVGFVAISVISPIYQVTGQLRT